MLAMEARPARRVGEWFLCWSCGVTRVARWDSERCLIVRRVGGVEITGDVLETTCHKDGCQRAGVRNRLEQ
jgi:hypothetical protein